MKSYARVLKLVAPVFFMVGAVHLILGPGADVLLGARLSAATLGDAVLDSQNRFYGVAFTVYAYCVASYASFSQPGSRAVSQLRSAARRPRLCSHCWSPKSLRRPSC